MPRVPVIEHPDIELWIDQWLGDQAPQGWVQIRLLPGQNADAEPLSDHRVHRVHTVDAKLRSRAGQKGPVEHAIEGFIEHPDPWKIILRAMDVCITR